VGDFQGKEMIEPYKPTSNPDVFMRDGKLYEMIPYRYKPQPREMSDSQRRAMLSLFTPSSHLIALIESELKGG
jgi:hypothetical protein